MSARRGFSLTELLVVIAIIAILFAFLMPATRRVRVSTVRMVACQNNLRQLMLALLNFESTGRPVAIPSRGHPDAPTGKHFPPGCFGPGSAPEERLSWMVALLPYLDQDLIYKRFDPEKGYAENRPAAKTQIKLFLCPGGQDATTPDFVTSYIAMAGIGLNAASRPAGAAGNGFMGYDRLTSVEMIRDGTSNTIALMETSLDLGPWARGGTSNLRGFDPADVPWYGDQRPFGGHGGGINVAMADGSVRFLRSSVDPQALAAAITIAAGEPVNLD